jgi:hypothetical protein
MLVLALLLACKKKKPTADGGAGEETAPVVTASTSAAASSGESPADTEISKRLLAKLHAAALCPSTTSPQRVWCIVDGYATGTAAPLPPRTSLVGLTVGMSEDFPGEQSLARNVELAAVAFRGAGTGMQGWLTSIHPKTPQEQSDVGEAVLSAGAFFKDKAPSIQLAPTMHAYVKGLPDGAKYNVAKGKQGWIIDSRAVSDVRKVGNYWVAVEVPPARPLRGIYVSIFTDKYTQR